MKQVIVGLVMAVSLTGCATLKHADGTINVAGILNDMRWGVMEACDVQWLPQQDCTLGLDALTIADGIVAKNTGNVSLAVQQSLKDVEATVPTTSRLRPYLDGILIFLSAR